MIKMISGETRIGNQTRKPADGWFCAPPEAENRLVRAGAAVYAQECGAEGVATLCAGEIGIGTGANPPASENTAEGVESAHLDPEQLGELTNAKLRELAEDMGIDTARLKTKTQLIEAITAEEVSPGNEDGEAPPALDVEAPVV